MEVARVVLVVLTEGMEAVTEVVIQVEVTEVVIQVEVMGVVMEVEVMEADMEAATNEVKMVTNGITINPEIDVTNKPSKLLLHDF